MMEKIKRGRGRPRTITDMKSYKRDKMREYRAAKKAATEASSLTRRRDKA